jgi:uncharacterized membrane protein (DUF485 family)
MSAENTQFGTRLFVFYFVFYTGFVLTAAFAPDLFQWTPLWGVNLAIWYGFALILVAILLAVIYGWRCQVHSVAATGGERQGKTS